MKIDNTIKKVFREMCLNRFPGKLYKLNLDDTRREWCYVQAGSHFRDYIHYELIKYQGNCEIQFHIEFDTEAENIEFYNLLPPAVQNKLEPVTPTNGDTQYKWYRLLNDKQQKEKSDEETDNDKSALENLLCQEPDADSEKIEEALYKAFSPMIDLIEPCIVALERGALRSTVTDLINKYRA